jgi:hypothetical protein
MREFEEAIYRAAELVLNDYLAGGNRSIHELVDISFIAFVYEEDEDVVADMIRETVDNMPRPR